MQLHSAYTVRNFTITKQPVFCSICIFHPPSLIPLSRYVSPRVRGTGLMLKCSAAAQPAAEQITKSRSATGKHITNRSTLKITTYSVYRSLFASRRRRLPNEVSCCLFFGALSHPFLSSPLLFFFWMAPLVL